MQKNLVVIVGAGPAGLAVAACLSLLGIPFVILEKEDCVASLWRKRSYDRIKLHLAKEFCGLPRMPHPPSAPTFIPKDLFLRYLDDYVARFGLRPELSTAVQAATYDAETGCWTVDARDVATGERRAFEGRFLVAATGENSEGFVPAVPGLGSFGGDVIHSSAYRSGAAYAGKRVLVVGCGNSGMEVAYDLSTFGAKVAICVRSPFHVVTKEMIHLGMVLLQYLPVFIVDALVVLMAKLVFGDLSKYGIVRPKRGPFISKEETGRSPVIDVGTIAKIKAKEIKVVPEIEYVKRNEVVFSDGQSHQFDAIVFATGYKSSASKWLMDGGRELLDEEGLPKRRFPEHWKGKKGVYFAGFAKRGIFGISMDAEKIADDIKSQLLDDTRIVT